MQQITTREEWLEARKELLAKEKEFTRLRDQLSAQRRALPWVKVAKTYNFTGPEGQQTLADLFDGRSQLLVYHFMFDPDWQAGCKSCSYLADHYNGAIAHLQQRDVTMVTVSRAPLPQLQAFRERMGWTFKWVSSHGSDFNYDFHVTFSEEDEKRGEIQYNYTASKYFSREAPGISAFVQKDGEIFHTYSAYARGLDLLIGTYNLLDLTAKGRDEGDLPFTMSWLRLHDEY